MLVHYDTETIATHYLSAIFNGDSSGLGETEQASLDAWLNKQPENATFMFDEENEEFFGKDAVTGLMATCVELQIYTNE